ncbi:MAG: YqgE/AlgH family protein [Nitrospinota bacterium]|nr:YqgE/AlgH family protein [Nitrospinota bacterium]
MEQEYGRGYFLIANPVLPDPNFSRTVVLLCNHNEEGSFGLVVNRPADLKVSEVLSGHDFPKVVDNKIYFGGPVSQSQVFFLCRSNKRIPDMETVCPGIQMGIRWDSLGQVVNYLEDPERDIRFYLGYSGWAAGQLAGEMEHRSWLTCHAKDDFVFGERENEIWHDVLRSLGKDYEYLLHAPTNPNLN